MGTLTLRVDNTSLVLATTAVPSAGLRYAVSLRPYLLQESLQNNPSKAAELVTTVGDEFTGFVLLEIKRFTFNNSLSSYLIFTLL